MDNLPLASTASLESAVLEHLGVAINGEVAFVFPRGTSYIEVKRFADKWHGHIRLVQVRCTFEILPDNKVYDTSPKVLY